MPDAPVNMPKSRARQLAMAKSDAMKTRVNEKAGDLTSFLRLDPMVNANLERKWGVMWHKDKARVEWVKRNYPETAPQICSDKISVGYSGGEGLGRLANRFGRVKSRTVFRDGKLVTFALDKAG